MPKLDFLNTDFEMLFQKEPKPLLQCLGRRAFVLYSGREPNGHLVAMELSPYVKDPLKSLRNWFRFLKSLPPAAQRALRQAKSRVFDLGFDVTDEAPIARIELPQDLLEEMAQWKASYVVTLYRMEPPSSDPSRQKQRRKPKSK